MNKLILVFIFLFFSGFTYFLLKQDQVTSPLGTLTTRLVSEPSPTPLIQSTRLKEIVQDSIQTNKNTTFALAIKNLKTGENYYYNEHTPFTAASLYKLWVMGETYEQIDNGQISEDDVANELKQMIIVSDNTSADALSQKINLSSVGLFLGENDFTESQLGSDTTLPITTAYDTANFLEKLYQGGIINTQVSQNMLTLLKQQQLNNVIPKYLPQNLIIAHKTGQLNSFTHDAGIIFTDSGDYIFTALSDSDSPATASETISQISKNVFDYFSQGGDNQ